MAITTTPTDIRTEDLDHTLQTVREVVRLSVEPDPDRATASVVAAGGRRAMRVDLVTVFAALARLASNPSAADARRPRTGDDGLVNDLFAMGLVLHLTTGWIRDPQIMARVTDVLDQVDGAVRTIRTRSFAGTRLPAMTRL